MLLSSKAVKLGEKQEPVKVVQEFEYLGSTISQDSSLDVEVCRQVSKASHVSTVSTVYYGVRIG